MGTGALGQIAQALQQRVGARRNKTRGDDGQHALLRVGRVGTQPVHKGLGVGHGLGRTGVFVIRWALRGLIHGHLAHQRALAVGQAALGQHLVARVVHGAKVHGGGGAVGQQRRHDHVVHTLGKRGVAVARLQREGVVLKPDFQRHIQRFAVLRPLGGMHMQIHHAGQQVATSRQTAQRTGSRMGGLRSLPARVVLLQHRLNHALRIHTDQYIGLHPQLVGRRRVEGRALQRPGGRHITSCCGSRRRGSKQSHGQSRGSQAVPASKAPCRWQSAQKTMHPCLQTWVRQRGMYPVPRVACRHGAACP